MSTVYIGIGSNLGDKKKNIEQALEKLNLRKGTQVKEISDIIETEPMGDISQPKFLNAVARLETTLYPDELLDALKSIEKELGRDKDAVKRLSAEEKLRMFQDGRIEDIRKADVDLEKSKEESREEKIWGPRTIDLDILFYDDIIMKGNNLTIPHPLLHQRLFVLRPFAQIAPDFIHPILRKSINDLFMEYRVEYESS